MTGETTDRQAKKPKGKTHFAPVERAHPEDIKCDMRILSNSPFVDGIMRATGGLLAVLNQQRQVLAVNDAFLRMLGIDSPEEIFGLRPGEALDCIHAHDGPGGCGTGRFCATCGAVIAMMASMIEHTPQQRECVATVRKDGKQQDLCFLVHSSPIQVENTTYLLLFLQDITISQNRAALENLFFHDVKNM
ncbi:PAS domain-containing protein, partial [Planctomycetota bacterium]